MANILFIQPFDFPNFLGQKKRKRFLISRAQFEVGYQVAEEHDFSVLDLNLAIRQKGSIPRAIKEATQRLNPDLVFLTYPSFPQGEQVALVLRCLAKIGNVPVVMGGSAISLVEDAPLRWWSDMNIACCYNGFGNQISAIVQNILIGKTQDLPGVFWTEQKPSRRRDSEEKLIDFYQPEDLYSAKGRIDFSGYVNEIKEAGFSPSAIIELTRGCLHRCSFCAINRKNFGFFSRSPGVVMNEIEYLADTGINSFHFSDPTFGLEIKKTNELIGAMILLREKYPRIRFEITTRADVISRKNAVRFNEAGVVRCDLGMETMSGMELASVHKGFKKEKIRKAVRYLAEVGIETKLFHITFPQKISIPTIEFLLELSQNRIPFLVQSAYLRGIPNPLSEPLFYNQDQKVFCRESDSIEQIMEWMLVNLAFRSINTFLYEPQFQENLRDALSQGIDLKTLFEISQSSSGITLNLKADFDGQRYFFRHKKKTPFTWCFKGIS